MPLEEENKRPLNANYQCKAYDEEKLKKLREKHKYLSDLCIYDISISRQWCRIGVPPKIKGHELVNKL
jgi:hypothetical protein